MSGPAGRQSQAGHPATRPQIHLGFSLHGVSQRRLEHWPPAADGGQILVPRLGGSAGQKPELLDLDRPARQQSLEEVGGTVAEQPPAKARKLWGWWNWATPVRRQRSNTPEVSSVAVSGSRSTSTTS